MYQKGWSTLLDHINKDAALKQRVWTQLGMKRGLPPPPLVLNHLENLPDEMVGEILLYVFDGVGLDERITIRAMRARDISVRMQKMIDLYILRPVKELSIAYRDTVTEEDLLLLFPNLETLRLYHDTGITDAGLRSLTRLKTLDLTGNETITDQGLSTLSSLEALILNGNKRITDNGISQLPQLKKLDLTENSVVKGYYLWDLTQLETLVLKGNSVAGIHLIGITPTLKCLNLDDNKVPDLGVVVRNMTNLEELSLFNNETINDNHLASMTQLKALIIPMDNLITLASLSALSPQLTYLDLWANDRMTNEWLDLFRYTDTLIILSTFHADEFNLENLRFITVDVTYMDKPVMRRLLKEEGIVLRYYE